MTRGFAPISIWLAIDPLHALGWARRQTTPLGGDAIWFAPLEYVIVRKLEHFAQGESDSHIWDIQGVLRVGGEYVDRPELERLIAERGFAGSWERVKGVSD